VQDPLDRELAVASQAQLVKVPDGGSAGGGRMQGNALRDHADVLMRQQIRRISHVGIIETRTGKGHGTRRVGLTRQ
jgi:hypothetical protein